MTANAMPEDKKQCMKAGMVAHIPKPVKPQYLFNVLQKWVVGKNETLD